MQSEFLWVFDFMRFYPTREIRENLMHLKKCDL